MKRIALFASLMVFVLIAFAGWKHSVWTGDNKSRFVTAETNITRDAKDIDSLEAVEAEVIQGTFGTADLTDTLTGTFVAGGLCTISPVDTARTDSNGLWVEKYATDSIIVKRNMVGTGAQKYNIHIIRANNP